MNKNNGYWITYEEQPNNWCKDDASYIKLYNDLKNGNTGWEFEKSKSECEKHICGEMIAYDGTDSGTIYVYYENDENTNERKPIMYIKSRMSCINLDEKYAEVFGRELVLDSNDENRFYNFEVEPQYLEELIKKLREIGIPNAQIEKYQNKLDSYNRLLDFQKNGINSEEDILELYRNFNREDTILPRILMKGRNVQKDYESLSFDNKVKFVDLICKINSGVYTSKITPLTRLKSLTGVNQEDKLLEIKDIEVLKRTATSTELENLKYASEEILNNYSSIIDILNSFEVRWGISYAKGIPYQFRTDIGVIQALTQSRPSSIRNVIDTFIRDDNGEFKEKLKDKEFVTKLINVHYTNTLNNKKCVQEQYVYTDFLWHFPDETLDDIENKILVGPEPTEEREQLKGKIYMKTKQTCEEIRNYKKAN